VRKRLELRNDLVGPAKWLVEPLAYRRKIINRRHTILIRLVRFTIPIAPYTLDQLRWPER
jgi:hypothetical protein